MTQWGHMVCICPPQEMLLYRPLCDWFLFSINCQPTCVRVILYFQTYWQVADILRFAGLIFGFVSLSDSVFHDFCTSSTIPLSCKKYIYAPWSPITNCKIMLLYVMCKYIHLPEHVENSNQPPMLAWTSRRHADFLSDVSTKWSTS